MTANHSITTIIQLSKLALCSAVLMLVTACGGKQTPPLPPSQTGANIPSSPAIPHIINCLACPVVPPTPSASQYFNDGMIGHQETFTDGSGHHTFYNFRNVPASNYFSPDSIIMNITKDFPGTYWLSGVPDASIDFVLSPNGDGSYRSPGWVLYFPSVIPSWLPCHAQPCSEQVQQPIGQPTPYMIVPPSSLAANQVIIFETTYDRRDQTGIAWDSITGLPSANVYWKTMFYMSQGLAVSEQWEGDCGHERWYFQANVGLISVESPNDGHGTGANCAGQSTATINRIN